MMPRILTPTYEFEYHLTPCGTPCVVVKQPHRRGRRGPYMVISMWNVFLASWQGCGHREPGVLVCGYQGPDTGHEGPAIPGWVVGHFDPDKLRSIYNGSPHIPNSDRRRWYGIRPGDRISLTFGGRTRTGTVFHLDGFDNNRCYVKWDDTGKVSFAVAEWCRRIDE